MKDLVNIHDSVDPIIRATVNHKVHSDNSNNSTKLENTLYWGCTDTINPMKRIKIMIFKIYMNNNIIIRV